MGTELLLEQAFNGVQLGMILFLMAVGVTLAFGVMNLINLAHGSMLMLGAYFIAFTAGKIPSFLIALAAALLLIAVVSAILEILIIRPMYSLGHLDQVLATFGISIALNEVVIMIWGREAVFVAPPEWLDGTVQLTASVSYPVYRLAITVVAAAAGIGLWLLLTRTRLGMRIRAGAEKGEIIGALGVNIRVLFTAVFVISSLLAALGGLMLGPLLAVQSGMGDSLLILALAVVVIGGVGSLKGALYASLAVGIIDTFGRMLWPQMLGTMVGNIVANSAVYILMAIVIAVRPAGLFGQHGR
ncbi:MAG: branched-chain amino acid ABC transporter permease [Betaproteobacteria bacterium]|nr:branched-chain amino acid ABC transporter permease [Betaproteobacteria bacterium]